MSSIIVVLGTQWGDEGKGKIVDLLASKADVVCRFNGGNNAGHTVVVTKSTEIESHQKKLNLYSINLNKKTFYFSLDSETEENKVEYDFHSLPSGVINENCISIIGNGCVINLIDLLDEINKCEAKGLKNLNKRLFISNRAHLVFNFHKLKDICMEEMKGKDSLGTTKKGIGPAYASKSYRNGMTIGEFMAMGEVEFTDKFFEILNETLEKEWIDKYKTNFDINPEFLLNLKTKLESFHPFYLLREILQDCYCIFGDEVVNSIQLIDELKQNKFGVEEFKKFAANKFDFNNECEVLSKIQSKIKNCVTDTVYLLNQILQEPDKIIVAEGANAALLDIDHGSYPFVTSSNCTIGSVCSGLGVSPKNLGEIIGVVKAYSTRVGAGPMPTELSDDIGNHLQKVGREIGVTTGRIRRCGWLDLVAVKYSTMINGYTCLAITKIDILSGLKEIKIATSYKNGKGELIDKFPANSKEWVNIEPVYETFEGWSESIENCKSWEELPLNAIKYLNFISNFLNVPIKFIGTGKARNNIIFLN